VDWTLVVRSRTGKIMSRSTNVGLNLLIRAPGAILYVRTGKWKVRTLLAIRLQTIWLNPMKNTRGQSIIGARGPLRATKLTGIKIKAALTTRASSTLPRSVAPIAKPMGRDMLLVLSINGTGIGAYST